ncbi:hypothetical protein ACFQ71_40285 [Streptomyces sp. NPDC056534]|uniref:hypothetical protein n=1 Tax=Streptomyces sp. NPDC056534 TaxID=3345857 RepID=UPI003674DE70
MIDTAGDLNDRRIPSPVRADLIAWQQQGFITITRASLPDAPKDRVLFPDPQARRAIEEWWNTDSPLRRAALAGLTHLQNLGVDLDDVDLAGRRLPTPRRLAGHRSEARWWVNWKWQGYAGIPYCVTRGDGWLEIVQPTRTCPLSALVIRPGPKARESCS